MSRECEDPTDELRVRLLPRGLDLAARISHEQEDLSHLARLEPLVVVPGISDSDDESSSRQSVVISGNQCCRVHDHRRECRTQQGSQLAILPELGQALI